MRRHSITRGRTIAAAIAAALLTVLGIILALWNGHESKAPVLGDKEGLTGRRVPGQEGDHSSVRSRRVRIPAYEVLDTEVYDAPIKTQVVLTLLVPGSPAPEELRALLRRLSDETGRERCLTYHRTPTHVFIYAYPDRERAEAGGMGWVARLEKVGRGADTKVYVNDKLLAVLKEKPVERFGLSEQQRKRVYWEIVLAEDRGSEEAKARFPTEPYTCLKIGQETRLTKQTPLMPFHRYRGMSDFARIRHLPPGSVIQVLGRAEKASGPWYRVKGRTGSGASIGTGWINSIALIDQIEVDVREQLRKRAKFEEPFLKKQKEELARKYGVTVEQLEEIGIEGSGKHWPMP